MGAPAGSTYNTGGEGLWAIYRVLEAEQAVTRWERIPARLKGSRVERLVLWNPSDVADRAWDDLLNWVSAGGVLIVGGPAGDLPGVIGHHAENLARPVAIHPIALEAQSVSVGDGGFDRLRRGALILLARPDGTPVLASWAQGDGQIYWSSDTQWLSNQRIDQADNLETALMLLRPIPGSVTAFDEYHHGYQVAERWWQILRGPMQSFLLYLAAALALFYWAHGVRFGSPTPLPASPPRAAMEYVYSMSQLYRRARARPVVLAALHRSLMSSLGRLIGSGHGLDHEEISRRCAPQVGLPPERIRRLLDRLRPGGEQRLTESELLALARETEEMQRRVRHAGFRNHGQPGTGTV